MSSKVEVSPKSHPRTPSRELGYNDPSTELSRTKAVQAKKVPQTAGPSVSTLQKRASPGYRRRTSIIPATKRLSLNVSNISPAHVSGHIETALGDISTPATRSILKMDKRSVSLSAYNPSKTIEKRHSPLINDSNRLDIHAESLYEKSQTRFQDISNSGIADDEQLGRNRRPDITILPSSSSQYNDRHDVTPTSSRVQLPTGSIATIPLAQSEVAKNGQRSRVQLAVKSKKSLSPLSPSSSSNMRSGWPNNAQFVAMSSRMSNATARSSPKILLDKSADVGRIQPWKSQTSMKGNGLRTRILSPTDIRRKGQTELSERLDPPSEKLSKFDRNITPNIGTGIGDGQRFPKASSQKHVSDKRRSTLISGNSIPPVPPLPDLSSGKGFRYRSRTPEPEVFTRHMTSHAQKAGHSTEPRRRSKFLSSRVDDNETSVLMPPLSLKSISPKTVSRVSVLPKADASSTDASSSVTGVSLPLTIATDSNSASLPNRSTLPGMNKTSTANPSNLSPTTGAESLPEKARPHPSVLQASPLPSPLPSGLFTPSDDRPKSGGSRAGDSTSLKNAGASTRSPITTPVSANFDTLSQTPTSIRQRLNRTLGRPLGKRVQSDKDHLETLSSQTPPLPDFPRKSVLNSKANLNVAITTGPTPAGVFSPTKRSFTLSRLAAFKDRAIAEFSPSRSATPTFSPVETLASKTTFGSKERLEELDDIDREAEREMALICSSRQRTTELAKQLSADRQRQAQKSVGLLVAQVVKNSKLNIFEKGEILDFRTVYFCGVPDCAKITGNLAQSSTNFGYDDDRGDYRVIPGDHLAYRYEILGILGKGSFGQVVRCIDHKTGGLSAVKIIRNKKRFHSQALMETKILQNLCQWDPEDRHHFVRVTHNFYFRGHLCIATELLSLNLYEFVKLNEFKGLSLSITRRIAKQILGSLCVLQRQSVIHCDLKPENILLVTPESAEIKLIDFGSSCYENDRVFTYVQSRFYRSPEVILGLPYGLPIDMWSLGCILAELHIGYPIFPGENEQEQIGCIMEVMGPPAIDLIEKASRRTLFFDSTGCPRVVLSAKGRRRVPNSKPLSKVLQTEDLAFIDFIECCLRWDTDKRLKPNDAIQHPFITGKPMERGTTSRDTTQKYSNTNTMPAINRLPGARRPLPELPGSKPNYALVDNSSPKSSLNSNKKSLHFYLSGTDNKLRSSPYRSTSSGVSSATGSSALTMSPSKYPSQNILSPGRITMAQNTAGRPIVSSSSVLHNGSPASTSSIPRIVTKSTIASTRRISMTVGGPLATKGSTSSAAANRAAKP